MKFQYNNKRLEFNAIIYINGTSGSDTTGNGSIEAPYKTLAKANTMVNTDNTCIYVINGTNYTVTNLTALINLNYRLTYLVQKDLEGLVTISLSSTGQGTPVMTKLNSFIGFKFRKDLGGDARFYEYFYDGATLNLEFLNCGFEVNGTYGGSYPIATGNSSGCTITKLDYINCSFMPAFSMNNTGIHTTKGTFINCAFTKSGFTTQPYNLTGASITNSYFINGTAWKNTGTGFNPDGTIANIGVFGGDFGWGAWDLFKFLLQDGNNICNTDGNALSVQDILPYTIDKFNNYGMIKLTNINPTVINKIINEKFNISVLKV